MKGSECRIQIHSLKYKYNISFVNDIYNSVNIKAWWHFEFFQLPVKASEVRIVVLPYYYYSAYSELCGWLHIVNGTMFTNEIFLFIMTDSWHW